MTTTTPQTDFLLNYSFTRPDENDAVVYEAGFHIWATTFAEAEAKLRAQSAHLTIRNVELFAAFNEDGDPVPAHSCDDACTSCPDCYAATGHEVCSRTCAHQ